MKATLLTAVACVLTGTARVMAGTIDFENAPPVFWADGGGGNQDLGGYYQGVTFGPGAQIVHSKVASPGGIGFPAHSGILELTDTAASGVLDITFATPQTDVSFFYNTEFGMTVTAFDSSNNPLEVLKEAPDLSGNAEAVIDNPGVKSITITDSLPLPEFLTIDDLTAPDLTGNPVPDATSTLGLFAVSSLGMLGLRRKFAA